MTTKSGGVDVEKLTNFAIKALQKVGVPEEDARITANILVATDLRGIESHGVGHLNSFYVTRIKQGFINTKPDMKVISQAPSTATMDGDRGLGFVVGHRAMAEAMDRAVATGAGFVTVRNSTHYGAGGNYSMMALPRNMIGISMTTGGVGVVVPGGSGRGLGLNVISIAAPANEEAPFVLDMAISVVAGGKVEIARRTEATMPEGWAVDKDGNSIADPNKYYEVQGAILPLGGTTRLGSYKGFGLGVAVDILCSILSGSPGITQLLREPNSMGKATHFFGALRIDSFMPADEFKRAIDGMIRVYKALPKAAGVDKITLAGEPEQEKERERRANGIPLHPVIIASLKDLAKELDIEYDL